ncbi:MAG TPA: zf-TFIIB domain-containing protein [Acidimicrobiales bacterium]
MKCPVCDVALSISSREGVEIDFCPQCRGVWLDRGELDKVIERAAASLAPTAPAAPAGDHDDRPPRYDDDRRYDRRYDDDRRYGRHDHDRDHDKRRKRRSFLDDLFDFD